MMDIVNMNHTAIEDIFFKQMKMLSIRAKKACSVDAPRVEEEEEGDYYSKIGIANGLESDSINSNEAGFLEGYISS